MKLMLFTMFFLFLCMLSDIKNKRIPDRLLIVWAVAALAVSWGWEKMTVLQLVSGLGVGFVMVLISLFCHEQIGMGDSLVFCILGLGHGFTVNLAVLALSLFLSSCTAAVLLFTGGLGRKDEIAFMPFVFTAYVMIQCSTVF